MAVPRGREQSDEQGMQNQTKFSYSNEKNKYGGGGNRFSTITSESTPNKRLNTAQLNTSMLSSGGARNVLNSHYENLGIKRAMTRIDNLCTRPASTSITRSSARK